MSGTLFLLIGAIALVARSVGPVDIHFRQFSISPSLSGVGETLPFDPNYGSGQFFIDYVRAYTAAIPGPDQTVNFIPDGISWGASGPCSVLRQVGQQPGCANASRIATMDAGTQLNPVWGFMYNSGPAFGPNFEDFFDFLSLPNGAGSMSGLELLQSILDSRGANVQIIPAVGSPRQSSGYLQKDAWVVGLAEICKANWTWRFLPPNQFILDRACDNLVGAAKRMHFVNSVSGLGPAPDVQQRLVNAFEYSTEIDNYDARTGGFFPLGNPRDTVYCSAGNPQPACTQNPGEIGLRYMHYPGWHQNWFAAWMYIAKPVWNDFSQQQKDAIRGAGFNAMKDSWNAVSSNECFYLQKILDINNGVVQKNQNGTDRDCNPNVTGVQTCSADMKVTNWRCKDLRVIQEAATQYLDSLAGPSNDQMDLAKILDAYNAFTQDIGFMWHRERYPRGCTTKKNLQTVCDCCDCDDCDERKRPPPRPSRPPKHTKPPKRPCRHEHDDDCEKPCRERDRQCHEKEPHRPCHDHDNECHERRKPCQEEDRECHDNERHRPCHDHDNECHERRQRKPCRENETNCDREDNNHPDWDDHNNNDNDNEDDHDGRWKRR